MLCACEQAANNPRQKIRMNFLISTAFASVSNVTGNEGNVIRFVAMHPFEKTKKISRDGRDGGEGMKGSSLRFLRVRRETLLVVCRNRRPR